MKMMNFEDDECGDEGPPISSQNWINLAYVVIFYGQQLMMN